MAHRAVHMAARLSPDVVALHLTDLEGPDAQEHEEKLRSQWSDFVERPAQDAGLAKPTLVIEGSPYRSVLAPLLREMASLRARCPKRPVMVILSELVGGNWWEAALHTGRTRRLRAEILKHGGDDISVLVVPWQLEVPETERMLAEEEPLATA